MTEDFSNSKFFTISLAIFYIFALISVYKHFEILAAFIILIILILLVFFFNLTPKKALILYLIFFLGILRANKSITNASITDNLSVNNARVEGQIITSKDINLKNNKIKFYLRVDNISIYEKDYKNINTKILINIDNNKDIENKIVIGDYISLKGNFHPPNPSTNPYQFDYRSYLSNNNCKNILYAYSNSLKVERELKYKNIQNNTDRWYFILKQFEKTRNKIIEKHSKNIKSPKLEILGGIVFGSETINPDENTKENFKNSGLLHLLAASGLNVALIYGIWWWIANLIRFPYNLSIFLGAVFVIFYTFMTGFPPSILRASVMLLFVLLGKIIDRSTNSVALIFFVAFLILLCSPKMIFDVGFQLSFAVTFGLIFCCEIFISKFNKINEQFIEKRKKYSRIKKYFVFLFSPKNIASIITVPLVAQLWVIPLQLHYFNNLALYSILANILVIPFIGILSFIGFVSSIFALIPGLDNIMVFLFDLMANPLLGLLVKISAGFSSLKFSLINASNFSGFQIFNFWALILIFTLNLKDSFKNKKQAILFLAFFFIFLFSFIKFDNFKHNFEIMMFDTGNSDCFLIKSPENKYILIDSATGIRNEQTSAKLIINRFLLNERIKNIELMIVSNFNIDNCAGVIDILKNNKIKKVIIQNKTDKSDISKEILEYLDKNKIDYKVAKNDEIVYKEKDFIIKTFNSNSGNENSIVSLFAYKDKNMLFMGECGVICFDSIRKYLPDSIELLKVGHHGAKNTLNSNMLDRINPRYALISAGGEKYGYPHYSTVRELNRKDIKIISTKNYGFIKAVLDKDGNFKFKYFDFEDKKLKNIFFNEKEENPFDKSEFVLEFVKKNQ